MNDGMERRQFIRAALDKLGIERLVLTAHDAAFPSLPDEDIGRGTPGSAGARALVEYAANDGFDTIQLGPQGALSADNPSPYDGALFARSPMTISLPRLVEDGLLPAAVLEDSVRRVPPGTDRRVRYRYAWSVSDVGLRTAWERFRTHASAGSEMDAFVAQHESWLVPEALFDTLAQVHRTEDWTRWNDARGSSLDARLYAPQAGEEVACRRRRDEVRARYSDEFCYRVFCQMLAHREHEAVRRHAASVGIRLFGDFQIGISRRNAWSARPLFLPGYFMGAPPSRTNPEGQPWAYPVLHPSLYQVAHGRAPGPALAFLRRRIDKLLGEYDGLRVDHPHGLVCPWVYRADAPEPLPAVRAGARLFSSPHVDDHPELATFAIARPDQLAPAGHPRYADDWVRELSDTQVERYAVAFDLVMDVVRERGLERRDIACEVLSTCPEPLRQVLERHGLGRFRVTQKADPTDRTDPYRSETARPQDWIMVGTHDTPSLALVLPTWTRHVREGWAAYLAERLASASANAPALTERFNGDDGALCQAMFADLFAGPARQVKVFFADWLGMTEIYNRPGTVHDENWMLRIPRDYRAVHEEQSRRGFALDTPSALAMALRSRAAGAAGDCADLADALEQRGRGPR